MAEEKKGVGNIDSTVILGVDNETGGNDGGKTLSEATESDFLSMDGSCPDNTIDAVAFFKGGG